MWSAIFHYSSHWSSLFVEAESVIWYLTSFGLMTNHCCAWKYACKALTETWWYMAGRRFWPGRRSAARRVDMDNETGRQAVRQSVRSMSATIRRAALGRWLTDVGRPVGPRTARQRTGAVSTVVCHSLLAGAARLFALSSLHCRRRRTVDHRLTLHRHRLTLIDRYSSIPRRRSPLLDAVILSDE